MKLYNALGVILIIRFASVNLAALPVNRCINAMIAKSHSIILNVINPNRH